MKRISSGLTCFWIHEMSSEPSSSLSTTLLKHTLAEFQHNCGQIEVTISKCLGELLDLYKSQWEITLKAESGELERQLVEKYKDNKQQITKLKADLDHLTTEKEDLLRKIEGYERYICILSERK